MLPTRNLIIALLGLVGLTIATPLPADDAGNSKAVADGDNSKAALPDLKENYYDDGDYYHHRRESSVILVGSGLTFMLAQMAGSASRAGRVRREREKY